MSRGALDDVDLSSSEDSSLSDTDVFPATDLKEREMDREDAEQAHINAVRRAQEILEKSKSNLTRFRRQAEREKELDREHKALIRKKMEVDKASKTVRKPIRAPGPFDTMKGPPTVRGRKPVEVEKTADETFALAAKNTANLVMQLMVELGVADGPVLDSLDQDNEHNVPIALPLTHEQELEFLCVPEQMRHEGFQAVDVTYTAPADDETEVQDQPGILSKILKALAGIDARVQHLVRIQQLHTISHVAQIRAQNLTRQLCVADGTEKVAVYRKLHLAMKSVTLASDPVLGVLPFGNAPGIEHFFLDKNRVMKLANFLLVYIEYDKAFVQNLLCTVVSVDLQNIAYWKSGTANNG